MAILSNCLKNSLLRLSYFERYFHSTGQHWPFLVCPIFPYYFSSYVINDAGKGNELYNHHILVLGRPFSNQEYSAPSSTYE